MQRAKDGSVIHVSLTASPIRDADGEIYQANLTRRLEAPFHGDPWPLYRRLRTGDPSLFSAYLDLGPSPETGRPRALLSASPEPFLSVDEGGLVARLGSRETSLEPVGHPRHLPARGGLDAAAAGRPLPAALAPVVTPPGPGPTPDGAGAGRRGADV